MKIKNIKFKAKRLDGKGWAIGDLLHSYENGAIIVPIEGGGAFSVDPSTVCQFTGENDMNGNEIYIGDIISNLETGSIIEVTWNERLKRLDCKFLNADKGLEVPFGIFVSRCKRIVVVGNKFDKEK